MDKVDLIVEDILEKFLGEVQDDEQHEEKDKKKKKLKSRGHKHIKTKKGVGGSRISYDYDEYESKNKPIPDKEARDLSSQVDMDRTNIADVAHEVFPDHTDNGAQSQLRKVLNGERPMTRTVYNKLKSMLSNGQIAVKI